MTASAQGHPCSIYSLGKALLAQNSLSLEVPSSANSTAAVCFCWRLANLWLAAQGRSELQQACAPATAHAPGRSRQPLAADRQGRALLHFD